MRLVHTDIASLYRDILSFMLQEPPVDGHKNTSAEIVNAQFVLTDPTYNLMASKERKFNYRYMVAEMLWNAQPTNEIKFLTKVFPGVVRFVEDQQIYHRDRVAWAYGFSIYRSLDECYAELVTDPGSRRAVMRVFPVQSLSMPGTPPCLVSIQFLLRGGRLSAITQMRSNDVWRGFPLDVYQFTMWQAIMAAKLGVPIGDYYHNAGSFHIYERDRASAQAMLEGDFNSISSSSVSSTFYDDLIALKVLTAMDRFSWTTLDKLQGSVPWLATYIQDSGKMATEFAWLKMMGYGSGWD